MNFCEPNLPQNTVTDVFVSAIISKKILNYLDYIGVNVHFAPMCSDLNTELAYHPDIILNNPQKGLWLCVGDANMNKLLTKGEARLSNKYPGDCKYNCFIINKELYGGKDVAMEICDKASTRHVVSQGYTKCSTVILTAQDFITSDPSVYNLLKHQGKNVLKVTNEGILLNGFSCGFIGGCTGVLGGKILSVLGDAKLLKDYDKINCFCKNIGYNIISLSNDAPYDFGGLLPIAEK